MIDLHPDFNDTHTQTKEYLSLPRDYLTHIGGAKWCDNSPGLAFSRPPDLANHREFVGNEEIAQFIEGFASQRSLLPFGVMAHWVMRFAYPAESGEQLKRLRKTFCDCREQWRNAGALAGMISEGIPDSIDVPSPAMVCTRLRDTSFPIQWFTGMLNGRMFSANVPSLTALEFEEHVCGELARLADADLKSWLALGRGPVNRAGKKLAIEPPPRTWGEIVDELLERPRLAGARPHVAHMVAALSVPPRRRDPQLLPMGGYSDVVTHGSVDRLLPSQHALDDLEFLRRFTENELLYFRREEPPTQTRDELVVALDQGIRTWGDVRLVLTAAALALAQRAERKEMRLVFTCTSRPGLLTLTDMKADDLGAILESSDLSRDPGLAIERVLETQSDTPRDIFLLTHPFALEEHNVQTAGRRLGPRDRLFALTVNGRGEAELVELRRGMPVRQRAFHVDFVPATTPAATLPPTNAPWTGPVEPIEWPFRFCPPGPVQHFDFDDAGQRLLAALAQGMLCVWNLAPIGYELLPRPTIDGVIVKKWLSLVGVADGFALLTRRDGRFFAFHYDLTNRTCTPFSQIDSGGTVADVFFTILYMRRHNKLVVFESAKEVSLAIIDLTTKTVMSPDSIKMFNSAKVMDQVNLRPVRRRIPLAPSEAKVGSDGSRCYYINSDTGAVKVSEVGPFSCDAAKGSKTRWAEFVPKTQGRPTFGRDREVLEVQLAGETLAILSSSLRGSYFHLSYFRGPDGHFLAEQITTVPSFARRFLLSPDGKYVALVADPDRIEVQTTSDTRRVFKKNLGTFGAIARLWVGDDGFVVQCGRKGHSWHLVNWSEKFIVHSETNRNVGPKMDGFQTLAFTQFFLDRDPVEAYAGVGSDLLGESERYKSGARRGGVCFVLDAYGQVLAFDAQDRLVFQFYAFGDSWSAWLPTGVRAGRGSVHFWPNPSVFNLVMGCALRSAAKRGTP